MGAHSGICRMADSTSRQSLTTLRPCFPGARNTTWLTGAALYAFVQYTDCFFIAATKIPKQGISKKEFLKEYTLFKCYYMYMYVCGCMYMNHHVCARAAEDLPRVSDPLALNLQAVVSHHVNVLSTTEPSL